MAAVRRPTRRDRERAVHAVAKQVRIKIATLIGGQLTMKYFFLEEQHLVPFEQRDPNLIVKHRQFLQRGYDKGHFLLSGPSIPPTGGVLVARAESRTIK